MLPIFLLVAAIPGFDLETAARGVDGRVGAAVMLLETRESAALRGNQHFPMQSVYKLPIGMAVLTAADKGKLRLDDKIAVKESDLVPPALHSPIREKWPHGVELTIRDLLRYMVSESDGTASDVLLKVAGGPAAVTTFLRGLGIDGVMVATSEAEMARDEQVQYRNWATPVSMVALLRALHEGKGLSPASRQVLMQLLIESPTGPKRIKGMHPPGTVVAHKTGTSGTSNGLTRATNDAGIVALPDGRHFAVAVFVSDSRAGTDEREAVIARVAKAAWGQWTSAFEPRNLKQGDTIRLRSVDAESARMNGRTVRLFAQPEGGRFGLMPVAALDKPGSYTLEFVDKAGAVKHSEKVMVLDARFPSQNISIAPSIASLKPAPGEQEAAAAFRKTVSDTRYWQEPLDPPLPGCMTSPFGVQRLHNGKPTGDYHAGIDQRGAAGAPISAVAAGVVRLARQFQLRGGTVGIDHGQGFESMYLHMSKLAVAEGAQVKQGDVIGYVGSTGRSTGPHLHWSLYVNEVPVNPSQWVRLRPCGQSAPKRKR